MLDSLRKLARVGIDAMSSERAEELARSVVDQGQALLSRVGSEVRKRMRTAGIVTKEELSELKRRVRLLEREVAGQQPKPTADGAAAGKTSASGAKKTTAGPAKKAAAKRGAARRPRP